MLNSDEPISTGNYIIDGGLEREFDINGTRYVHGGSDSDWSNPAENRHAVAVIDGCIFCQGLPTSGVPLHEIVLLAATRKKRRRCKRGPSGAYFQDVCKIYRSKKH
jgi:hypothetical protein